MIVNLLVVNGCLMEWKDGCSEYIILSRLFDQESVF